MFVLLELMSCCKDAVGSLKANWISYQFLNFVDMKVHIKMSHLLQLSTCISIILQFVFLQISIPVVSSPNI